MTTTRKKTLLHCGILTGILGAVVLLIFLVHPGCVYGAQTDWSNQHFAIPEYFRTRFYATGNLFPNFAMQLGGGQNIFNFAYYGLYSPVILLSFAFPWLSMATYLQISNILLTLLSAFLCYFWLRKWFVPNLSLFMAVLYLLAAPVIFHSHHHIMFVNYFPFLFWALFAVHHALEKRCSLSLIAASACILLTSFFFSVGAFFAILIYAVFLTLHQHHVHLFRQLMRTIGITCLHLLLGTVLAAFLLLPVAWTLLHGRDVSGSSQSLWSLLLPGMHLNYLTYSPFSIGMTSFSILAICAMLCFPQRAYRFLAGVFGVILACPLLLYLMNGTMYLDPKAYIPLLPLLLLLCGFFWKTLQSHQIALRSTLLLFSAVLGMGILSQTGTDAEQIAVILDGLSMLAAFLFYFRRQNAKSSGNASTKILLIPTLAFSTATCLTVNLCDTYMSKEDVSIVYSSEIQTLTDQIAAEDDGFYRISNEYHAGDTVNRIWGSNYYRSSVYSSVHNAAFSDFYFRQTHNENGIRNAAMIVQSKNPVFGILMGEKYLISQKPITRYGFRQIGQEGAYLLYENTLAYPIGFATANIMTTEELKGLRYPNQLEALLENAVVNAKDLPEDSTFHAKQPDSIHQIAPSYTAMAYSDKQITAIGNDKYYVHSKTDFSVTVTLDEPIDDLLLLKFHVDNHLGNGTTTGDVAITINGIRNKLTDPQWKYQNNNNNFQYTLSSDKPIQKLKLKFSAGDYVISKPVIYTMEYQVLEDTSAEISPWQLHHDTLGDDTMAGSIQVKQDGWFVLAVPYDIGFHVTVDGKETAYSRTDTDFLGFPITQGKHQISITYTAPLAKAGKYCSAAGIGLTLLFFTGNCWLRRRKQKQHF